MVENGSRASFTNGLGNFARSCLCLAFSLLSLVAFQRPALAEMDAECRERNPNGTWECTIHPLITREFTYGFPGYPKSQCLATGECDYPDKPWPFYSEGAAVAYKKGQIVEALESNGVREVCSIEALPESGWYNPVYWGFEYYSYLVMEFRDWVFTAKVKRRNEEGPCSDFVVHDFVRKDRVPACNDGGTAGNKGWRMDTADPDSWYCKRPLPGTCPHCNPVYIDRGERRVNERDIEGVLGLSRTYRSLSISSSGFDEVRKGAFGLGWMHSYEKSLVTVRADASPTSTLMSVVLYGPEGTSYFYPAGAPSGGVWNFTSGVTQGDRLWANVDVGGSVLQWVYVGVDDVQESYDAAGRLQAISGLDGNVISLSYDANLLLTSVSSSSGRTLDFHYDAMDRISRIVDGEGKEYSYSYDEYGNLIDVGYPHYSGDAVKSYEYGSRPILNRLASVTDEDGDVFSSFSYLPDGRAESSSKWAAPGIPVSTFSYNYFSDNVVKVVDPLGEERSFTYVFVAGYVREASLSSMCPLCGGNSPKAQTYDTNGNAKTRTEFSDYHACYGYDLSRNLETVRVESVPPGQSCSITASTLPTGSRKLETAWHSTFRKPVSRTTKNAAGVLEAKTTWSYNARGQATARCEIDPADTAAMAYSCSATVAPPIGAKVRRTVTTYCEQADVTANTCPRIGLVMSVNGPRPAGDTGMASGQDDVTTYAYYQTDDSTCASNGACPHRHGDLWKVTNAIGHVIEYVRYDKAGRVTRLKDANGTITDFTYHPRGWLTDRIVRGNASGVPSSGDATTHIDYDAVGSVKKVTQPGGAYLAYTYDDAHRLIKIADNLGNTVDYCPGGLGSAQCLDAGGNRRVEQIKDPSGAIKRALAREYNQLSQLVRVRNAASAPVEESAGLSATGVIDGYDRNGNRVLVQDGLGTKTKQGYDGLDRLVETIQDYNGTDPATANSSTGYVYDARDNLRAVTDPDGLSTQYDYDGLNNLTGLHSPDTGDMSYAYDLAGNRTSQTDARGVTSTYTYDALNRLTGIAYPVGKYDIAYAYDESNAVTGCWTSYPLGRLTTMTDASGSTTYCYDRRGNVTKKTQIAGAATLTTSYTYTAADRVATITYPSGDTLTYTRDALGRVTGVDVGTVSVVSGATYYPFGPLHMLTYGSGRTLTKSYDQDYAIDSVLSSATDGLKLDFDVDVMGSIVGAKMPGAATPASYTYDSLYRLKATSPGSASGPAEAWTYNKTGDRLSAQRNSDPVVPYAYASGSHRLAGIGGVARTYDANGNTQTGIAPALTLNYDDRNRLTGVAIATGSISYAYNGRGERVGKDYVPVGSGSVVRYAYDESGHLLGEYGSTGAVLAEYVYVDDVPVAVMEAGKPSYIETDHLGTPRVVVNATTNAAKWTWDFFGGAFGTNAPDESPGGLASYTFNLRFPGQYYDSESGLHYNYFRDYESSTGRYVESDPIGLNGGSNTYSYSLSRPLTWFDYYGLTGAPVYRPENNNNPAWLRSNNCYSYVLNKSGDMAHPLFGGGGTQPGEPSGKIFNKVTCEDLRAAAKRDGAKEPGGNGECGGDCPDGYYKIRLIITDKMFGNDYHWFRQDANGSWSSKRGLGAVSNHGPGCPAGAYYEYKIDCGALCVKY